MNQILVLPKKENVEVNEDDGIVEDDSTTTMDSHIATRNRRSPAWMRKYETKEKNLEEENEV